MRFCLSSLTQLRIKSFLIHGILQLENKHIFKYHRVCRVHFEQKYCCRNNRLSKEAVPTKNMPGLSILKFNLKKRVLGPLQMSEASTSKGSVRYLTSKELIVCQFGNPLEVVKMRESVLPPLGAQDVLVRMLAAPVNPSDINTIQGKYPVNLELPCVLGNEGVGVVEDIGGYVSGIIPGNKVVVTTHAQGTWRDIAIFHESVLKVVPNYLRLVEAATLTVNSCTAFRLLSDFKQVRNSSMVVIQNGANSACGQNVIQICKAWGVNNINIVRNRPEINELKSHLQSLGATYVLTEEELRSTTIFREKLIDEPSLALNCVGGKSSLEMLRKLAPYGCMVTYGGMSREPVTIPTAAFIFKNLTFYGFWITSWNQIACDSDKDEMLSELISLMVHRKLEAPVHKMVKFDEFADALCKTLKGFQGYKCILDFC